MEEFRLRNNEELQGTVIYEAKQYAEMSVKSNDGNENDDVDAIYVDRVTRLNKNKDEIKSEKNKNVSEGIKSNDDKYEIHTEVMKSGNEGIFNDDGKSDVIEEDKSMKQGINKCYGKFSLGGDSFKGEKQDKGESRIISEGVESRNEIKDAHDIVIGTREMEVQINKNNDDNSDVAKIKNMNMNDVPCCSKIVMEKKKQIEIKIVQMMTILEVLKWKEVGNWKQLAVLQTMKIPNMIMKMLIIVSLVIHVILLHLLHLLQ